ncbi:hypothetical protein FACS18942_01600 [Planctomycetales bacterium]|nr:hypothetical protein FACS18942_01600 [Planctomycetales bacterium]GHT36601.1 hypothetical protein FACS189427_08510 [Planctomycetales bacterium]
MDVIRSKAYARAGLIGNPSDGYNGKTISVIVKNFRAQVTLYEWDYIEILPSQNDESVFPSIQDLSQDVRLHGYYGGIRLVKATIKGFADYCHQRNISLHRKNFSIRYESDIPRNVGMAGSSAIITAAFRGLMQFYQIKIPKQVLPSLILSIEKDQLGIAAGLQDRVAQVFEGCTYMDFSKEAMQNKDGFQCGQYEPLPIDSLPPLYISYSAQFGEPTEVLHNNLRFRYEQKEPAVLEAMQKFAALTVQAKKAIQNRDAAALSALMDTNFDTRRSICKLPKEHIAMVETARSCGASAKLAGSGGAIIGTYPDEQAFLKLQTMMNEIGCTTIKPELE